MDKKSEKKLKNKRIKLMAVILLITGLTLGIAVRSQWIDLSALTEWTQGDYQQQETVTVSDVPDFIDSSLTFSNGESFEGGLIVGNSYDLQLGISHTRTGYYLSDTWELKESYDSGSTWSNVATGELQDLDDSTVMTEDILGYSPSQTGDCIYKLEITGMSWSDVLTHITVVSTSYVEATGDLIDVSNDLDGNKYDTDTLITTEWIIEKTDVGGWLYLFDYSLEYSDDGGSTWTVADSGTHDIIEANGGHNNGSDDFYIKNGDQYTLPIDHTTPTSAVDYQYRLTITNLVYAP